MIKVILVEDDSDFQQLLTEKLSGSSELELVTTLGSAESFLHEVHKMPCDVVVMDIHLPGISGIEAVRQTKALYPKMQFVMCTIFDEGEQLFESLKAGAVGYILKYRAADDIVAAVKEIYNGGSPISPAIARKMVLEFQSEDKSREQVLSLLTPRELEVLQLLAKGYRYKEIAAEAFISEETVRTHVRHLYEKLQVQSRTDAINKAFGSPKF